MRRQRVSLRTIGRKERVWGQIGVRRMPGIEGWVSGPPAEREYAVLPVGVLIMQPSAWMMVRRWVSP